MKASARSRPFLQASAAKWLAIAGAAAVADDVEVLAVALLDVARSSSTQLANAVGGRQLAPAVSVIDHGGAGPCAIVAEIVGPSSAIGQMTIFAMVRNSCSEIGRSLQRRCVMAAAPMLPASATSRGRQAEAGGQAAEREVGVAAADRVDDAGAQRRQGEVLVAHPDHRAVGAVGDRQRAGSRAAPPSDRPARQTAGPARAGRARLRCDSGCSSRRRRTWSAGCSRNCSS